LKKLSKRFTKSAKKGTPGGGNVGRQGPPGRGADIIGLLDSKIALKT